LKKNWSKWEEEKWFIEDKGYTPYHVVDGQQRLTTFIVMLSSILQLARKNHIEYLNGDYVDSIANQYIVEYKMPEKIVKAYLFGYEKDNPSFEYLRYHVLGEDSSGTLKETFYTSNLEFAKKYFDEKLKAIYEEKEKEMIESYFCEQ
jgi:uncharacterized protein with ParB-like and HNH nuclease domain